MSKIEDIDKVIESNWYPFKINDEEYHLEVRVCYDTSQVRVCVWDWDKKDKQIINQVTDEWKICK